MADKDMVIKSIENCLHEKECDDCSYEGCIHAHGNCIGDLMANALELLKDQPKQRFFVDSAGKITPLPIQPQWISVKKKLPEQAGYSCLVSAEYGDGKRAEFIAFTGYGESEWYTYDALFMEKEREADNRVHHNYHITHWMPLPEPPEEVKQDGGQE